MEKMHNGETCSTWTVTSFQFRFAHNQFMPVWAQYPLTWKARSCSGEKKTYTFSGTHVTFRVWSLSELWKSSVEIICQTFSFVISDDNLHIGVRTVRENVCKLLITLLQNQGQLSVPSIVEETLLTHWRLLISKMEFYFFACNKINMTL